MLFLHYVKLTLLQCTKCSTNLILTFIKHRFDFYNGGSNSTEVANQSEKVQKENCLFII